MIEIINVDSVKMMAMVIANVRYMKDNYIIYCIEREGEDANIFVSKLKLTSDGYIFDNNFLNGEKRVLENLIKKIINKDDIVSDGYIISNDIVLGDVNYFDVEKCYVSTVSKKQIKDIMIFYKLVTEKTLEKPVVEIVEDTKIFNEGFVSNIFVILFGIGVIIFSIFYLVGVFN